jgi:nitroreductase
MNEEMYRGLLTRRANRSFDSRQITDEELQKVLTAGMYAPTAKGAQSPIIIAVQNSEEIARLNALNTMFGGPQTPYYSAPTVLIVLVPTDAVLGDLDGAAVLTNLCNGAHAVGLASCWVNRPQYMFETNEGREMLKRWGVEGSWRGVGSVALGYASAPDPQPKPRKENYCYIVK